MTQKFCASFDADTSSMEQLRLECSGAIRM